MSSPARDIISGYEKQFVYYRSLGQKAMDQVRDEDLFHQRSIEENTISTMVKHLWGNMMSRWTDFLTSDGEKEWRKRDEEFDPSFSKREEVQHHWDEGWTCLLDALSGLDDSMLFNTIYIRNQGHTVQEAINRQLAHYAYHVGQIVLLAKQYKGEDWQSLSIARNASAAFNAAKFQEEKHKAHYTDEWTKDEGE
jgi:hypothetical protein